MALSDPKRNTTQHDSTAENGLALKEVSPMVTVGLNSSNNLTRAKATTILKRLHQDHGYQGDSGFKD